MASGGQEEPFSRLALAVWWVITTEKGSAQSWIILNNPCRECFCKTNCWQELHFEFSRQSLNRNVQSPSVWWWLITQPRPIWKKAPPGLQRPSRTGSGISGVLYWPKLPVPQLGLDPRYSWGLDPRCNSIIKKGCFKEWGQIYMCQEILLWPYRSWLFYALPNQKLHLLQWPSASWSGSRSHHIWKPSNNSRNLKI